MKEWIENEEIETPETEILEENIYIDENLIKNKSLVRMDMNVVQYPLFSKNTKRKVNQIVKYYFNTNRDTYINVAPKAGDYIPGEAEEKVFIALMKIMKKKGMPRKFIVTSKELKDELKINSNTYVAKIKESLSRLASANYQFKNTMYSSKEKTVLSEVIETTILSLRTLSLNQIGNERLRKEIDDKRVKEVYEISISTPFYDNIMTKGYLVYNSDVLLSLETSTARTLYMLVEKLRFDQLYLKLDTLFLIKRIPLKFNPRNPSNTIKILEKNFEELKSKNLIEDFKFIKDSTWEKSEIEIFFSEEVVLEKNERFFEDFNDFKKLSTTLAISDTEHDSLITENSETEVSEKIIEEIFEILPSVAKKLKSMRKTIADNIEKFGKSKVKKAAIYISQQKNLSSPRAYFLKTLENNWAEDILLQETKENNIILQNEELKEITINYDEEKNIYFEMSENEKKEVEKKVYINYIKECGGQETKFQKFAFEAAKENLIYKYIFLNKKEFISKNISEEPVENKKTLNILNDIISFNDYINENIELYKVVFNFTESEILKIKREILKELSGKFVLKELTLEEINKTISEKIKC
ncbi:hypothetical protein [Cetobacterium sp. SF1]|uniref:hypothetical protein n=1 Tax=Cetobacterium sp. SF1 TaxID=3417654 RepID=UPI003CE87F49